MIFQVLPLIPSVYFIILITMAMFFYMLMLPIMCSGTTTILIWEISNLSATPLTLPIIVDPHGMIFSSVVLFISANVMLFSNMYMQEDPFMPRFTALILAFVLSMNILIFFPHLITLFLGWDGLGVISFILVIYYQNPKSLSGGMITALTNRIGDAFLLLSIGWTLNQGHWYIINMWNTPLNSFLIMSILGAAMTKSAQIPFSSWLPAAMAAPTPVSSLVHSSTLVTAGVFLLIRFYPFLSLNNLFNFMLLVSATLTMFMAGLAAMAECDLKKIIALSTLSQLGVMMTSLGLGMVSLTLFHLMTHALFKALLFLCAGNIIHLHSHGQDLRTVGNLSNQLPLTMSCMFIANLSLCGAPFLAGFYSKDMILEMSLSTNVNTMFTVILFIATALTVMYSFRLMMYSMWAPSNQTSLMNMNEEDMNCMYPIIVLTFGAITGGSWMSWLMLPLDLMPILSPTMKLFTLFMVIIMAFYTMNLYSMSTTLKTSMTKWPITNHAFSYMWFLSPLSSQWMMKYPLITAHMFLKSMDQSWIESTMALGPFQAASTLTKSFQYMQNNIINTYIYMGILPIIFIPLIMYLST
uniref:NADH-ubiquinone oxidoreductase chain 5 n=1 Tax=Lumbriclymenella robusta TaxID=3138170 RepID=A0AB38ZFX7_9ANNE